MPNPFRVGDRVRRNHQVFGGTMLAGTEWVISEIVDEGVVRVQNDPSGRAANRMVQYFELIEPQRVHTFYYVLYSERGSTEVIGVRRAYEESAINFCNGVLQDGGIVHAKKKITVRY